IALMAHWVRIGATRRVYRLCRSFALMPLALPTHPQAIAPLDIPEWPGASISLRKLLSALRFTRSAKLLFACRRRIVITVGDTITILSIILVEPIVVELSNTHIL